MGKRVSVKRERLPEIAVKPLRDPQERTYLTFGVVMPALVYVVIVAVVLKLVPQFGVNLLAWLVLGLMVVLGLAGSHKRRMLKRHPRSKVTGSAHPELRLLLNQQCRLLGIKKVPELYVVDASDVRALVRGVASPYLVLTTRLLQVLTPRETEAVMATLVGHLKAGTVPWRTFLSSLREANGLLKIICLPYLLMATLMAPYHEVSNHAADRLALLLLDGNSRLLTLALVKLATYSSATMTDDQRRRLESFLQREGMEARAEDVEQQMILGELLKRSPGLKERLAVVGRTPDDEAFDTELGHMEERVEKLQVSARG
ncbi:MAG: M48 family metalloprotease [Armatimonadetes bacterium]|nr:M48 family metalloprotease [Armatimonadota bacterium]